MSSFHTNHPMATGYLPDGCLARAVSAALGKVSTWNRTRMTKAVLSKLSTHELADIGLTRGDIDRIGRKAR